jgi:hypothetical protein
VTVVARLYGSESARSAAPPMTALDQCRRPLRVEKSELFEEAFDAICRYAGRLASLSASEPQLAARDPAARVLSRRQDDQEGVIVLFVQNLAVSPESLYL